MGAKSSSAPAPDPALTAANIKSLGIQDDAISQMMSNSAAMQPYQMQGMQQSLQANQQAMQQAAGQYKFQQGQEAQLGAATRQMSALAGNYNSSAWQNQQAGMAGSAAMQANSSNMTAANQNMARMGVDPNSGRALSANANMAYAGAGNQAGAMNQAYRAAQQMGFAATGQVANALNGVPSQMMGTIGASAQYGSAGLGIANSALAGMNSGYGAASNAAAGMGQNAAGMYNAMGNYQIGMNNWASANNPLNTIGGALAGGATAYGMAWGMAPSAPGSSITNFQKLFS